MHNFNLPTLSSDLIHQLALLLQQPQPAFSPSSFEPHQSPKKNFQYKNEIYWQIPYPTPIIRPQPLQQQFFLDPRQYNIKRLGQKCNTLLKTLTEEQLEELNEIINESLCDSVNDNERKSDKLEELNLEEKIVDDEPPGECD
ncbi:1518_t:CDS:2 [Gigaspora margarita]|uniref:1518_t:CDS:1 n=1 Tax=Gigaspora margarita TaxID=4874 RepID=A0ABN7W9T6_GIGMA|nr:1518_t:CDS:2 [Gigaspora margarita]